MQQSHNYYLDNPLIHRDRQRGQSSSAWIKSFACDDVRPLIICRGPIRKEAMDVFDEMGIHGYGILLSEKDSITYTNALAPELRKLTDPDRVHRVPDYSGATREERIKRIEQIIRIARDNGYNAIFAGYGFMAEDEEMVASMEAAGLNFIGPCSATVHGAGLKDEAKRTALQVGVSVTPGIDNATTLTLLGQHPDRAALEQLCKSKGLEPDAELWADEDAGLEALADSVLNASYAKGIDLFSVEELGETLRLQVLKMFAEYPENRVRLKAIAGGGGKGQRILAAPSSYEGSAEERAQKAAAKASELLREILAEVKCNGVGDNKNVLVELNIETTRHQEIQVLGNGDWCVTLGGRDCSLQMHEQKLLEVSVTQEELAAAAAAAEAAGNKEEAATLAQDLKILVAMEDEASRFGKAVGLDSVSTFESIVDGSKHFFMEMNTRIQVEHRVTELCYKLRFINPENSAEFFDVESLVEAMVLLARHGQRLPKPERLLRENTSVEARMNATNQALQPHAGGLIENWSEASPGEIRDDQGICVHNPDTDIFMKYHLAGAYDSNIALLLTTGVDRLDTYQRMAEILRCTELRGKDLATNLQFHYGLVNWFIGNGINARPTTRFIVPYLTAVGALKQTADNIDLNYAYGRLKAGYVENGGENAAAWGSVLDRKQLLIVRPIERLFSEPHFMAGWLAIRSNVATLDDSGLTWHENPVKVLEDLYRYVHMDYTPGKPARYMIWDHDQELLSSALAFYSTLETRLGVTDYAELCQALQQDSHKGFSDAEWLSAQSAHAGFTAGCELLAVLLHIDADTGFSELKVNPDLSIDIPEALMDSDYQASMAKVLVPPPMAKSNEILAFSGGMYYPREAPGMEVYVNEGDHFEAGDVLYIVEVMKMFNKVYAPFAGTIDKVLIDGDGIIIKKGQPLFKVTPDEKIIIETPEDIAARRRERTDAWIGQSGLLQSGAKA